MNSQQVSDSLLLAGQIGLVPGSMDLAPGGPRAQSELALRHVESVLKVYNRSVADVVEVRKGFAARERKRLPVCLDGRTHALAYVYATRS